MLINYRNTILKPLILLQLVPAFSSYGPIDPRINPPTTKMPEFQEEKNQFLKMSIDEKRKVYPSNKFTTLDDVPTWEEYFKKEKDNILKRIKANPVDVDFDLYDPRLKGLSNKVSLWRGDITSLEIDAIVNAANNALLGGGGVDGAIHRAAGPTLKEECRSLDGCPTGEAKITGGYKLPAKYVIHTVGPVGENAVSLESCYQNSLNLLKEHNLRTIAFPCISTGVYGYPQRKAALVALKTVQKFLFEHQNSVDRIIFCLFLPEDVSIYENLMHVFFPAKQD